MTTAAHKAFGHAVRKAAKPDDAQLAAINTYALEPQTADSVYVRTAWAGHNAIDRDGEVIDDTLLMDIARTLVGKGLHLRHPSGYDGDSGPGVGRIFAARVVEMTLDDARAALREPGLRFPPGVETARLLEASFFLPRSDKNAGLIGDMDAGVAGDVSLGFRHSQRSDINDEAGTKIAMRLHGPGEGYELSLVWLGAQPGARVHKAATGGAPIQDEDHNMDLQQQFDALQADHSAMKAQHATLTTKATTFDAIKAALGDSARLMDAPDALAAAVAAGQAHTKSLLADIVKYERLLDMTGDSDEDAANAAKQYDGFSTDKLTTLRDKLKTMATAGGTGDDMGSDPNAAKPAGDDAARAAKATEANPVTNPLLTKSA